MVEQPETQAWRRLVRARLLVVGALFAVWAVVVVGRLVQLQVFQFAWLTAEAASQQQRVIPEPARRGDIVDRNGKLLAYSVDLDSIGASQIKNPEQASRRLCAALGDCQPGEDARLADRFRRQKGFAWVRRQVSPEQALRVAALEIDGVSFRKEPRRFYPNRDLAAHLLGFVNVDNAGLAGLEATYDREIRGVPGKVLLEHDSRGYVFNRVGAPPVPGATLELTIDTYLQHVAERELRAAVEENRAVGGSVVIMDPATGEILALANAPGFNPNAFRTADDRAKRNRAVQDIYDPGSTFKMITATAALDEKVIAPGDLVNTGAGRITIGHRTVEDTRPHGTLTFADVIADSSNVGTIMVGLRVGGERLGRYVRRFGFGTRLSPVDFPGENAGILPNLAQASESTMMSAAMGYEIGVTPLQLTAAACAIANGGELVQPRVLRAITDGGRRTVTPRKVIRRVMSPETAAELTAILEGVVDHGTAPAARLADFTVAGKTGTAQKLVNHNYSKTEYNASFVGFVPSRQPVLTIFVVIDTPRLWNKYYGGVVAAPVFGRIAEAALRHLAVPSTINPAPSVLVQRRDESGEVRVSGSAVPMTIVPLQGGPSAGQVVLPELRGLSGREALRVLGRLGINPRITGDGVVTAQEPPPGTVIDPGVSCRLVLTRPAPGVGQ
jgi:cell division protein FtsI (penicillin-binding protein 3)